MKLAKIVQVFRALHHDRSGDLPIGPMLLIGLIVIPLVFLLILFKDELVDVVSTEGKEVLKAGEKYDTGKVPKF